MKRKSKCYATPKWAKFCDGCRTNSTKCPYREKTRDSRHRRKAETQKIIRKELREKIDSLEKVIAKLKVDLSKEINSSHMMSEEYQIQIRTLRQEKAELQEMIESRKAERTVEND